MIKYTCKGPRVSEDSRARKGCGAVLTDIVKVVPEDGETHKCKCPKCGNEFSVMKAKVADLPKDAA